MVDLDVASAAQQAKNGVNSNLALGTAIVTLIGGLSTAIAAYNETKSRDQKMYETLRDTVVSQQTQIRAMFNDQQEMLAWTHRVYERLNLPAPVPKPPVGKRTAKKIEPSSEGLPEPPQRTEAEPWKTELPPAQLWP